MHRKKFVSYLLLMGALLLPCGLSAQDQLAQPPVLDEETRMEVQARLGQFMDGIAPVSYSCKAPLPMAGNIPVTDGYLRMQEYRLRTLERKLKSLDVRWNNYYSLTQWEISQDEGLMGVVDRFLQMKQEASDSIEVRRKMLQSLEDYWDAKTCMAGLDSTYNHMGRNAFKLSLTAKTAPQLEILKKKEALLFASVKEKFYKAREAGRYHLVSDKAMAELEDSYVSLKSKSDTIQDMKYQPLITRIKDYLIGAAALAVLLMFFNMVRSKIKVARQLKGSMKQYKDSLKRNGQDEYPTI